MKSLAKIISFILTVLMIAGSLECLAIFSVSATGETTSKEEGTGTEEVETIDYTELAYANEADRLATMTKMVEKPVKDAEGNTTYYQIWVDDYTGEVATVYADAEGTIINSMFTNPYDVGLSSASTDIKGQVLSQITVKYTDNDTEKYFYSYNDAVLADQIKVKNIKNGIRVEYTLGREEARMLVPRMISEDRYQTMLYSHVKEEATDFILRKFDAYYLEKNLEKLPSETAKAELKATFPITEKFAVRVFDPTAKEVELAKIEGIIKTYCPDYSYEEMDYDHQMCNYESSDTNPPLFKMALEYTLGEDGLTVRLPANGIRFNESLYQLTYIEVLPYMGAGNTYNEGFTFYPDGSGALFSFADPALKTKVSITGKVYGTDFAYQTISGTYQQIIRYPVFGVVENTSYTVYKDASETSDTYGQVKDTLTTVVADKLSTLGTADKTGIYAKYKDLLKGTSTEEVVKSRGYVAVLEEGDALASIQVYTDATENEYATVKLQFTPRPKDQYMLSDSIGVGSTEPWTVVCKRKYVGNYKIHYTLLTDSSSKDDVKDYYPASWVGMALAYRDYLEKKGVLTRLTADEVDAEHIPLYIETFGTLETTEKILSIPVDVMTPLTTFEDIRTMYEELSAEGLTNINFKLTGYANGGMYADVPYDLHWEKSVGGKSGFQDLLDYAKEVSDKNGSNMGIYPDFDFSYISSDGLFDAVVLKQHAGKTIDDRYSKKREYSATQQKYITWYQMVISSAYMSHFYEHLVANYLGKYENVTGISVGTLGSTLNTDFDEDEPYNREDSKEFTVKAFEYFDKAGLSIMTNGGNAFTWKYADHILGLSLDSSRYIKASYSVPFSGVVLHGYVQFADDPLNMEGDVDYALMKAVENGSSIYFTLSYQNTQKLKDDRRLSEYYSIRYDIWKEDVIDYYTQLNEALRDVQTKVITNHEFISGTRVPDSDEIEADIDAIAEAYYTEEYLAANEQEKLKQAAVSLARANLRTAENSVAAGIVVSNQAASNAQSNATQITQNYDAYNEALVAELEYYPEDYSGKDAETLKGKLKAGGLLKLLDLGLDKYVNSEDTEEVRLYAVYKLQLNKCASTRTRLVRAIAQVGNYSKVAKEQYEAMNKVYLEALEDLETLRISAIDNDDVKNIIIKEAEEHVKMIELYMNGLEEYDNAYYSVKSQYLDSFKTAYLTDKLGDYYKIGDEFNAISDYAYNYAFATAYLPAMKEADTVTADIDAKIEAFTTAMGDSATALAAIDTTDATEAAELFTDSIDLLKNGNANNAMAKYYKPGGFDDRLDEAVADGITYAATVSELAGRVAGDAETTENLARAWAITSMAHKKYDASADSDDNQKAVKAAYKTVAEGIDAIIKTYADGYEKLATAKVYESIASSADFVKKIKNASAAYDDIAAKQADFDTAYKNYIKKKTDTELKEAFDSAMLARDNAVEAYLAIIGKDSAIGARLSKIAGATDAYFEASTEKSTRLTEYNSAKTAYNKALTAFNEIKEDYELDPEDAELKAIYDNYEDAKKTFKAVTEIYEEAKFNELVAKNSYADIAGITDSEEYPAINLGDFAEAVSVYPTLHYNYQDNNLKKLMTYRNVELSNEFYRASGDTDKITEIAEADKLTAETFFTKINSVKKCMELAEKYFTESKNDAIEGSNSLAATYDAAGYSAAFASYTVTEGDITSLISSSTDKKEDEEEEVFDKYLTNDGKIVAVTYGEATADYKTFIINYNNFAVKVEYNDIVYTIPKYSYVSIYYN